MSVVVRACVRACVCHTHAGQCDRRLLCAELPAPRFNSLGAVCQTALLSHPAHVLSLVLGNVPLRLVVLNITLTCTEKL